MTTETSNRKHTTTHRAGRTSAFKAFRALRMMRPDKAVNHLSAVPERFSNSAALSELRRVHPELDTVLPSSAGGHHNRRGRKRLAAKKAIKAIYHNVVTPILPVAYVVSGAFSEGNASVSRTLMHTIANSPANALSRWFGKFAASTHVPHFIHQKMISMMVRVYGIDVSQIEKPMSQYGSLQEFFSRRLHADARPAHPTAPLTSPADCEFLRCGEVFSGMMVQIKGNEYPLTDLIGVPLRDCQPGNRRWFFIFHLRPKDYHRFHAPCDAVVHETVHLPGLLLPVTKTCANWVPNLFSELERVSMVGHLKNYKQRAFAMVPMGATCVGSISLGFDPRIQTNKTSSWSNFFSLFNSDKDAETRAIQEGIFQRMNFGSSFGATSDDDDHNSNAKKNNNKKKNQTTMMIKDKSNSNNKNEDAAHSNKNNSHHHASTKIHENDGVIASDDDENLDIDSDNEDSDGDIEIEFVLPRSDLTSLSEYGQRKGKRTIYAPKNRPEIRKGEEVGWFNWGSACIVVADLPEEYEPIVRPLQDLRVGQALVAPIGKKKTTSD